MAPTWVIRGLTAALLVLPSAACGDDAISSETDAATSEASAGTDAETDATTGPPFVPIPARDVTIVRVEANPGVAVPIGIDGGEVPGAMRNAQIPANRDMLVRVFVDVGDAWQERPIEARLTLVFTDGTEKEQSGTFTISEDTFPNDLKSGPYFGVFAEDVRPGTKYRVSLWEADWGFEDTPEPDPPPRLPLAEDDAVYVGVEDSYQVMRVVLVPVAYDRDGCSTDVDGEYWKGRFETGLLQENPAELVEVVVHDPMPVTFDMTEFSGLNNLVNDMSQLRTAENADPWVYYYGLFDSCGGCISSGSGPAGGCTVGLAAGITGDAKSDAFNRASAGQVLNTDAQTVETFVHEIGHTQGRRHVFCPNGGAAGTDPSYPYDNGIINVWGFGIRDSKLRHPTATVDYMSYCGPTWCSDWQWRATYTRIATLSAWELEDAAPEPGPEAPGGLLVGSIEPNGAATWWTVPGVLEDMHRSALHEIRFTVAGQTIVEAAQVSERPHYGALNVVAPLPAGLDSAALSRVAMEHVVRGSDAAVHPIALEQRKMLHDPAMRERFKSTLRR